MVSNTNTSCSHIPPAALSGESKPIPAVRCTRQRSSRLDSMDALLRFPAAADTRLVPRARVTHTVTHTVTCHFVTHTVTPFEGQPSRMRSRMQQRQMNLHAMLHVKHTHARTHATPYLLAFPPLLLICAQPGAKTATARTTAHPPCSVLHPLEMAPPRLAARTSTVLLFSAS